MVGSLSSILLIAVLAVALTAALFLTGTFGAEPPILFYFDDSTLSVQPRTINGVTYIPLREIVNRMALPYTEVFATETYSLRGPAGQQAILTRDARSISVEGRVTQLSSPILRDNGEWLAPLDFLELGLARVVGIDVRHRPDAHRVFAGRTRPPELTISAQDQSGVTRVTLRSDVPIRIEMRREKNRAVFTIDRNVDPVRERLEPRGRMVTSIAFDDADGKAHVIVETTDAVTDIRLTAAEDNRVHHMDFARTAEVPSVTALPAPGPPVLGPLPPQVSTPVAPAGLGALEVRPPAPPPRRRLIKSIVLDPGHGGIDTGAASGDVFEKNLTLAIARKMRPVLEARLGSTVFLTRDSDVDVTNEARSVLSNNNQAELFVSIHIGQSTNTADYGAVYTMKKDFAVPTDARGTKDSRLFTPWYLGYRAALPASESVARLFRDELELAVPAWRFPLRQGPLAVLASTAAPAIAIEIGNMNDPVNAQTLVDPAFQTKVANAAAAALERFAVLRQSGVF